MTDIELVDALCKDLKELFAGYSLLSRNGEPKDVQVFAQYIPLGHGVTKGIGANYSESEYDSNFPCIVVRFQGHTDSEENRNDSSRCKISLLFGVYDKSNECQGWRDVVNMMELYRQILLRDRVIAKQYLLEMPLSMKLLEGAETWPIYFGEMDINLTMPRPVMGHGFVYGKEV